MIEPSSGLDPQNRKRDRDSLIIAVLVRPTRGVPVMIDDGVAKLATRGATERSPRRVVVEDHDSSSVIRKLVVGERVPVEDGKFHIIREFADAKLGTGVKSTRKEREEDNGAEGQQADGAFIGTGEAES